MQYKLNLPHMFYIIPIIGLSLLKKQETNLNVGTRFIFC